MATKTFLVDDLDGGTADVTIVFAIEGESYSLDLSNKNADKFRKALAPYIEAAQNIKESRRNQVDQVAEAVERRQAIRAWAEKKGYEISARGKIPQDILDAYNQTKRS